MQENAACCRIEKKRGLLRRVGGLYFSSLLLFEGCIAPFLGAVFTLLVALIALIAIVVVPPSLLSACSRNSVGGRRRHAARSGHLMRRRGVSGRRLYPMSRLLLHCLLFQIERRLKLDALSIWKLEPPHLLLLVCSHLWYWTLLQLKSAQQHALVQTLAHLFANNLLVVPLFFRPLEHFQQIHRRRWLRLCGFGRVHLGRPRIYPRQIQYISLIRLS